MDKALGSQDLREDAIDFSIHDQTDMPPRHLSVLGPGVKAGTPVNDFVLFGEDHCKTDLLGEGSKDGLVKLTRAPEATAAGSISTPSPP
jgi:hypothetical protein